MIPEDRGSDLATGVTVDAGGVYEKLAGISVSGGAKPP